MKANKEQGSLKNKIKKIFLIMTFILIAGLFLSHLMWKFSGTNEWEFEREVDGVKVYSLKAPGSVLMKFKVTGRFQSSLAGIMKLMRDPNSCADVGCVDSYIIDKIDYPRLVSYTFRYPMPSPFEVREFVVLSEFKQDPQTKEIFVDYTAAPDLLPPSDCCIRVTHMNNQWRFTPLDNGEVAVEFIMDNDPGGMMPYFFLNTEFLESMHREIPDLQKVLNKEQYQNAVVEYVLSVDKVQS